MPDRFYDGQRGPDIRRELNNLEAIFDDAIANAKGPQGWSPVVAVVTDGARRVLQITDWTGGEGSKPVVTGFIGATGIVATAALAVDIRGSIGATGPSNTLAIGTVTSAASPSATITGASPNQTLNLVLPKGDKGDTGNTGPANTLTIGTVATGAASATITGTAPSQVLNLVVPQGIQGIQGNAGWSPIFATVVDGERRVLQLVDWTGGTGSKPATGEYVGATGLVATIAQAVDIRGPSGAGTGDVVGPASSTNNAVALFDGTTGKLLKDGGVLGSSAFTSSSSYATAAQGAKADSAVQPSALAAVATSGAYADLTGKPSIPAAQQQTDWDATSGITSIANKPAVIAAGATAEEARTAIGAGTSNLTLGTTSTTALAGNTAIIPEAPSDGKTYGRKNAAWVEAAAAITKLPILSSASYNKSPVSNSEMLDYNRVYSTGLPGTNRVVSCGNLFVAAAGTANSNQIATSPDGKTWTLRTIPGGDTSGRQIGSDDSSLVVAIRVGGSPACAVSTNKGVTWAAATNLPGNPISTISGPAVLSGVILVPASAATTVYRSTDTGFTWSTITVPATVSNFGLHVVGGKFCFIVGSNLYYSDDLGLTWNTVAIGVSPNIISFSRNTFLRAVTNSINSPVYETTTGSTIAALAYLYAVGANDIVTKINGMNVSAVSGTTWHVDGPVTRKTNNSISNTSLAVIGDTTVIGASSGVVTYESTSMVNGWFGN